MAIVRGGLHGRPSGNVAGVVYGAARTRTGKAVTARELVYPSNPRTAGQLLQRYIFLEALYATRHIGPSGYQDDWNRSIGQLPGFQSFMSIIMDNTDAAEDFNTPPDTPLGNLHFPGTFSIATGSGAAGSVTVSWSTETGLNGTAADVLRWIGIQKGAEVDHSRPAWFSGYTEVRATGTYVLGCLANAEVYQIATWIQGAGTADGLLSLARWYECTSHA